MIYNVVPEEYMTLEEFRTESKTSLMKILNEHGINFSPCQFKVEELRTEVINSLKDFEKGNYVTIEKMREKHPRL